jgi:hypothetical protein
LLVTCAATTVGIAIDRQARMAMVIDLVMA